MKFKPIITLAAIAAAVSAHAADSGTLCLRVGLSDGTEAFYEVTDGLEWHLHDSTLSVSAAGGDTPCTYEVAGISDLTYVRHNFVSLDDPEGAGTLAIRLAADGIVIDGAPRGSRCLVADTQGRVVADRRFDGSLTVESLAPGTYLVTVNDRETLKVTVR